MRSIVTASSLLAIAIGSLYDNNYLVSPNEIIWSDSVKLTWGNFGGLALPFKRPKLQMKLADSQRLSFLAECTTDIVYNREEDGSYSVRSVFYAGQSYFKIYLDTLKPSMQTLRHELYHFHLTELQSRYMRRDIAGLSKPNSQFDIDDLLKKYKVKRDCASVAYDRFTRHGTEQQHQIGIEKVIDSLLSVTSDLELNRIKSRH
jgi:hypothetical protein